MTVRQRAAVIMSVALIQACAAFAQTHWAAISMEPDQLTGQSVIAAVEGWYKNPDGTFTEMVGYFNRNRGQELDIPIGPNNKIEPGGPDQGQPTHFMIGRGWGLFGIKLPADFGGKKLIWSLTSPAGDTTEVTLDLNVTYEVNPFSEIGMGNTPPWLSFSENGPKGQGPVPAVTNSLTAKVGTPLPLDVWVSDDAKTFPGAKGPATPPATVKWDLYRGAPTGYKFSNAKPDVQENKALETPEQKFAGKASTTVTFSQPGDYALTVTVNDWSGDGGHGFVCCWTNGRVNVKVTQ